MIAGFVGVHPETGLRRGASWRTPPDTSTTDPTSPNALRHTTPLGCSEPGAHRVDLAPGNDIEQLPAFHVDDLRGSTLAPVGAFTLVSVSSNPTAVTIANRAGSPVNTCPNRTTAFVTVCQISRESSATSDTARLGLPTWTVAYLVARVVNGDRSEGIVESCSLHVTTAYTRFG